MASAVKYKLGDTVKVERPCVYNTDENTLAYVIAGELPPSCIPEYNHVILTTQAMVDEHNERLQSPPTTLY